MTSLRKILEQSSWKKDLESFYLYKEYYTDTKDVDALFEMIRIAERWPNYSEFQSDLDFIGEHNAAPRQHR